VPLMMLRRCFSVARSTLATMVLTWILVSSVPSSIGAPVELLQNGNFKNGLDGWMAEGVVLLDEGGIKILREGALSQVIQKPDLSFYLVLSYNVRTELPSSVYFARSLVTFYIVDQQGKDARFTVVGQAHVETGNSNWKNVMVDLFNLFRRDVGDPRLFQLRALKMTMELGFTTSVPPPAVAYFKDISLRRANPVRILLQEGKHRELPDRTELLVSVSNVGDVDASELVVTLISSSGIMVISQNTTFVRPTLTGGASWQVSWMLVARSTGKHTVTIRAYSEETMAPTELSVTVPIPGVSSITMTHTTTVQEVAGEVIITFLQTAFLVLVALLMATVAIPLLRSRRDTESVYRLRLLGR